MTPQEVIERLRTIPVRPKTENALDLQAMCIAKKHFIQQRKNCRGMEYD